MATITKEKNQFYANGANIDANYGPWNSVAEYLAYIQSLGKSEAPDGALIALKGDSGIQLAVNNDGEFHMVSGSENVPVTYASLKALRTAGNLVPGTKYRITDYVTMVDPYERTVPYQSGKVQFCKSAQHKFDVIVTAITNNKLSEVAEACASANDTYFVNNNLSAWELKYCLDNDTERFEWAISTGKGVIYYMKDEYGNECPYDFKNIQFLTGSCAKNWGWYSSKSTVDPIVKTETPAMGTFTIHSRTGNTMVLSYAPKDSYKASGKVEAFDNLTFTYEGVSSNIHRWTCRKPEYFAVYSKKATPSATELGFTYSYVYEEAGSSSSLGTLKAPRSIIQGGNEMSPIKWDSQGVPLKYYGAKTTDGDVDWDWRFTFHSYDDVDATVGATDEWEVKNNIIKPYNKTLSAEGEKRQTLNFNVFYIYADTRCINNYIGYNCSDNFFGGTCKGITLDDFCWGNSFGWYGNGETNPSGSNEVYKKIHIGKYGNRNNFRNAANNINLGNGCKYIMLEKCAHLTFGEECHCIRLYAASSCNFMNSCKWIVIAKEMRNCSFETGVYSIQLENSSSVTGSVIDRLIFTGKDYILNGSICDKTEHYFVLRNPSTGCGVLKKVGE